MDHKLQKHCIFYRKASLIRQAFLITPLHGYHSKTRKNDYAKKVIAPSDSEKTSIYHSSIVKVKDQCKHYQSEKLKKTWKKISSSNFA